MIIAMGQKRKPILRATMKNLFIVCVPLSLLHFNKSVIPGTLNNITTSMVVREACNSFIEYFWDQLLPAIACVFKGPLSRFPYIKQANLSEDYEVVADYQSPGSITYYLGVAFGNDKSISDFDDYVGAVK